MGTVKLDIKKWELEACQDCSDEYPVLTFAFLYLRLFRRNHWTDCRHKLYGAPLGRVNESVCKRSRTIDQASNMLIHIVNTFFKYSPESRNWGPSSIRGSGRARLIKMTTLDRPFLEMSIVSFNIGVGKAYSHMGNISVNLWKQYVQHYDWGNKRFLLQQNFVAWQMYVFSYELHTYMESCKSL